MIYIFFYVHATNAAHKKKFHKTTTAAYTTARKLYVLSVGASDKTATSNAAFADSLINTTDKETNTQISTACNYST
ncbi:MAG: hypothetical protein K2N23_05400 [Clostridia bacterium]|nr:hypothetical protein [Clostridia bacterium]